MSPDPPKSLFLPACLFVFMCALFQREQEKEMSHLLSTPFPILSMWWTVSIPIAFYFSTALLKESSLLLFKGPECPQLAPCFAAWQHTSWAEVASSSHCSCSTPFLIGHLKCNCRTETSSMSFQFVCLFIYLCKICPSKGKTEAGETAEPAKKLYTKTFRKCYMFWRLFIEMHKFFILCLQNIGWLNV